MIWCWRKKNEKNKNKKGEDFKGAHFLVIPDIFYGGKDPLIYHEEKAKKAAPKPEKVSSPAAVALASRFSGKKIWFTLSGLLVLVTAGISYYYFRQAAGETPGPSASVVGQEPTEVAEVIPPPAEPVEPLAAEPVEPAQPVETALRPLTLPRILLQDSADLDIDFLTDMEEEIFGTDSGIWDTDGDGYYDGQEVFNLYNPRGFAPVKLIDSGLVREYINPQRQYRVYYPIVWEAATVDVSGDHILFSSITGDFIEIRAAPKLAGESFPAWFARNFSGERFSDLTVINNRFKVDGYKRADDLVVYFESEAVVYMIIYQPAGTALDVPFRHIMQMIYQSFRPSGVGVQLPEQTVLPSAPEAS